MMWTRGRHSRIQNMGMFWWKYMVLYHTRLKLPVEKMYCKRCQYITIRKSPFHNPKHWWKPLALALCLCFTATLRFIHEAVQGFCNFLSDWVNNYVMRWFCENYTFIFITCMAETIDLHLVDLIIELRYYWGKNIVSLNCSV